MIDPKELRIGNLIGRISNDLFPVEITGILNAKVPENHGVSVRYDNIWSPLEWFAPIPITAEWLEKFGFVKAEFPIYNDCLAWSYPGGILKWSNFEMFKLSEKGHTQLTTTSYAPFKHGCVYVHQLQNVIFALTAKELTI